MSGCKQALRISTRSDKVPDTPGRKIAAWLKSTGKTLDWLSLETALTTAHLQGIINGTISITHSTAFRLQRVISVPAQIWLRMENELRKTREK